MRAECVCLLCAWPVFFQHSSHEKVKTGWIPIRFPKRKYNFILGLPTIETCIKSWVSCWSFIVFDSLDKGRRTLARDSCSWTPGDQTSFLYLGKQNGCAFYWRAPIQHAVPCSPLPSFLKSEPAFSFSTTRFPSFLLGSQMTMYIRKAGKATTCAKLPLLADEANWRRFCGILFTSSKIIHFCRRVPFVLKEGGSVYLGLSVTTAWSSLAHLHVISSPRFFSPRRRAHYLLFQLYLKRIKNARSNVAMRLGIVYFFLFWRSFWSTVADWLMFMGFFPKKNPMIYKKKKLIKRGR